VNYFVDDVSVDERLCGCDWGTQLQRSSRYERTVSQHRSITVGEFRERSCDCERW